MKWPPLLLLSLLQHPHPGKGDKGVVSKQTGQCCPPGQAPWSLPNGAAVPALGEHEWTSAALTAAGTGTNAPLCPLSHLPLLLLGPRSPRTMAPSMPRFTAGKGGGKARTRVGSCQEKGMQEGERLWRGEMGDGEIPGGLEERRWLRDVWEGGSSFLPPSPAEFPKEHANGLPWHSRKISSGSSHFLCLECLPPTLCPLGIREWRVLSPYP